jgi:hypothetical protein
MTLFCKKKSSTTYILGVLPTIFMENTVICTLKLMNFKLAFNDFLSPRDKLEINTENMRGI